MFIVIPKPMYTAGLSGARATARIRQIASIDVPIIRVSQPPWLQILSSTQFQITIRAP